MKWYSQPAVEAFFLVHAGGMEKSEVSAAAVAAAAAATEGAVEQAQQQPQGPHTPQPGLLEALVPTPPPVSPLPSDPNPSTSATSSSSTFLNTSGDAQSNIPPHQLKFLKFAGNFYSHNILTSESESCEWCTSLLLSLGM